MTSQAVIILSLCVWTTATARALGTEGRGLVSAAMAVAGISGASALLGTNTYIVRVARAGLPYAATASAVRLSLVVAGSLAFAASVVYLEFSGIVSLDTGQLFALASLAAASAATQVAAEHHLARRQAEQQFKRVAIERCVWTALPPLFAACVAVATQDWKATVAAASLAPLPIVFAVRRLASKQRAAERALTCRTKLRDDRIFQTSLRSWFATMLLLLLYRADLILLGWFSTASEVGIYSISLMAAECIWVFSNAKNLVLLPRFAGMERAERYGLGNAVIRESVLVTGGLAILSAAGGYGAVRLLLGGDFVPSYHVMLWLLPGVLSFVVVRIWVVESASVGESQAPTLTVAIGLVLEVVLAILLIPNHGAVGAAISCSVTYTAMAFGAIVFRRHLAGRADAIQAAGEHDG